LLSPRPIPKLEDHFFSALRDCFFNIFAATPHIWRLSPPSVTWGRTIPWWQGTHLTWNIITITEWKTRSWKSIGENTIERSNSWFRAMQLLRKENQTEVGIKRPIAVKHQQHLTTFVYYNATIKLIDTNLNSVVYI
jgi:hypothetical protein